jgi:hypothetical protein
VKLKKTSNDKDRKRNYPMSTSGRTLGWICNPAALNIRIFNPKKRITNAYIRCSRIANPTERYEVRTVADNH